MRTMKTQKILPEQRQNIRDFEKKFPCVLHKDLAKLFGVTRPRISEIIRNEKEGAS